LKVRYLYSLFLVSGLLALAMPAMSAAGNGTEKSPGDKEEQFDASSFILDHVADSHEWHLWTVNGADGHEKNIFIPLPVILYSKQNGLDIFLSEPAS
jgi:F-type H+-transporting ATPase subunit a